VRKIVSMVTGRDADWVETAAAHPYHHPPPTDGGRGMTSRPGYCADQLHEDDAGWIAPDGPDRYPICPDCQTQFECPPVRLMTAPRIT
jgi:hypothetical protein